MSLRYFHIVFISISTVFAAGFAVWALRDYQLTGNTTNLTLGIIAAAALLPILYYAGWFWRKSKKYVALAALTVLIPDVSFACAVCFGDPNSLMTKGALWGVGFLGIVIVAVLIVIGAVAYRWARRDSEMMLR